MHDRHLHHHRSCCVHRHVASRRPGSHLGSDALLRLHLPAGCPAKIGGFGALQESQDVTKGYKGVRFRIVLILALPLIGITALLLIKTDSPSFPLPFRVLELSSILSGTFVLGPVGAVCYMLVYHGVLSLARATPNEETLQATHPEPESHHRGQRACRVAVRRDHSGTASIVYGRCARVSSVIAVS